MSGNNNNDIRWQQRLTNFNKALNMLGNAVTLSEERELSPLEEQGLIQSFEFTHELAWQVLKDYFESQGTTGIAGSKDAAREAFKRGLIKDGETWMSMIKSRNSTSYTYNENTAKEISTLIRKNYFHTFKEFQTIMQELQSGEQGKIEFES